MSALLSFLNQVLFGHWPGKFLQSEFFHNFTIALSIGLALVSAGLLWNPRAFDSNRLHDQIAAKGHKGFDYRDIEAALRARMDIERTLYSPLPLTGPVLNSTVMWRCRIRDRRQSS